MGYVIQSVLLKRSKFTRGQAYAWMREHHYPVHKIHATSESFHFRLVDPERLRGGRFRTIDLGDVGRMLVVYFGDEK
jgi:hypothetical protein